MRYLLYIFILFSLPIFGQNLNQIRPDTAAGSVPMTMAPLFRMEYVRPQTLADTLAPYLPSGHSAVTLSGPYDYITLSGQDIIRGQIDLTTDVTGLLPGTNINSITESQISDLDHFTGADITGSETAFNGWDKDASNDVTELSDLTDVNTSTPTNRNVLVADGVDWESRALVEADISDLSHFTPSNLLTDYGFTDNSTNWNTAYGWGDHSLAGYLTTDTHIGNTDLIATGNRLIDFDTNSLTIFDVSALALTSLGQFTLTGAGSQIYATNAGVGITANGLRNITMDADSAVYISTWSGNIELASGEDFVIQTYGATLNDLRFDIDGGIFFVNELPELTTPTDTLLVRSGTGELMWMHAQALRQFGSTGEVGWTDPLWDDNYGNYFVAVTTGSVSSPADGEVPVYNSSIFGFEMKQPIGASEAYGSGWNGSTGIPTKNDVYDEIQTLPRLTTVNAYTSQQSFTQATLTDGANISWNLNTQQVGQVTLGGNRTLDNPTNQVAGGHYTIIIKQDGSGNRTLAYGSAYKFPGGVDPTLSTGISAVDVMTCVSDGTNMYCNLLNDYQ